MNKIIKKKELILLGINNKASLIFELSDLSIKATTI
jgi:hypothetical protein